MAASRRGTPEEREQRQRLREYHARQTVHREQGARRRRDNIVAAVAGLVVVALATVAQVLYFTAGPGTPVPAPTPSASATPAASPSPATTPSPTPSATG